jgi:hypothetical protein
MAGFFVCILRPFQASTLAKPVSVDAYNIIQPSVNAWPGDEWARLTKF